MVQIYPWFKIYFPHGFNIIAYHTPKQREITFIPRIELNHNKYNSSPSFLTRQLTFVKIRLVKLVGKNWNKQCAYRQPRLTNTAVSTIITQENASLKGKLNKNYAHL